MGATGAEIRGDRTGGIGYVTVHGFVWVGAFVGDLCADLCGGGINGGVQGIIESGGVKMCT